MPIRSDNFVVISKETTDGLRFAGDSTITKGLPKPSMLIRSAKLAPPRADLPLWLLLDEDFLPPFVLRELFALDLLAFF